MTTAPIVDTLPDIVPVFPLPNTVFFPYTILPLHIFEPRYRAMVRDARSRDRLIAVALAAGSDFHRMGTVGRIRDIEELPEGRFNIRLEGIARVEFTEVPSDRLYRLARLEACPEPELTDESPDLERAKLDLLATLGYLRSELSESTCQPIVIDERLPLSVVVNTVCAGLPIDSDERQTLLEVSDVLERQRRAAERIQSVLELVLHHKSLGGDGSPTELVN